ncbi:putative metallophosphoesterase YhaO [Clostridium tepidiprofundi DSM 19306]|uniref:Putative metallophosphoesterase YhaO n=1 Tax=Clostridium tepidiprofundi DSM 19306 TaxID=1121338 RepID=A0A151B508_9CLOT|nr:DNA repair exonuclease [Clostridium tepidiprofundi]KYH34995.1 putative metallophosphoesterase YhaO [Clostridium tepidiprofundi DSM 19306]
MKSKRGFCFIHAADIHLGSFLSYKGNMPKEIQSICKNAVYKAFEKICTTAINSKVDFMLISGDIYDVEFPSVKANKFFIEQCNRLNENNINVYMIYGNHDVGQDKKELFDLPCNVYIFGSERVERIEILKENDIIAKIIGQSYKYKRMGSNVLKNYFEDDDNTFNIALLHTSLQPSNNNYIPCTVTELMSKKNIDYWALGHVHKYSIINKERPFIAFPGIPQGRDMGEEGIGGCLLVGVNNNKIEEIKFVPTSSVVYKKVEITIDDKLNALENISDLEEILLNKAEEIIDIKLPEKDYIKGYIIQWIVTGRTKLYKQINNLSEEDIEVLIDKINANFNNSIPFLWTNSILFRVMDDIPELDDLVDKNRTFKEIRNVVNELYEDRDSRKEVIKNMGSIWSEKFQCDEKKYERFIMNDEIYESILKQAENLIIQNILGNDE